MKIEAGDVVVIRYEGPKGSPGMPHMETFMAAVLGKGLGENWPLYQMEDFPAQPADWLSDM